MSKSGWFNIRRDDPFRHAQAARGIKTGRKSYQKKGTIINGKSAMFYPLKDKEVRKVTSYVADGFKFNFMPIADTVDIKKTKSGFEVRYITQDLDPRSPDDDEDSGLFLVHYHRDFQVDRDEIITKDDARTWYQGGKIEQEKKYWIIPIEAYIHSGVALAVQNEGNFPDRRWDVSHVGLALASKEEFKTRKKARAAVDGLVKSWNQYLSGEVYGVVKETYNKNKGKIDSDSVWGYYGYEFANAHLEEI
jgi:hypothetical protein